MIPKSTVLLAQINITTIKPCDAYQASRVLMCLNERKTQLCYTPARCVATSITEPLLAGITVHHTRWVMDTTVADKRINKTSELLLYFVKTLHDNSIVP